MCQLRLLFDLAYDQINIRELIDVAATTREPPVQPIRDC